MIKDGKHGKLNKRKVIILAIVMSVSAIVFTCIVTVAIFTSSLHAQRTIAAYDTEGARFSSNYLLRGNSKDNVRTLFTTNTTTPVSGAVTVCNYQQGRQTLPYPDNVGYTLAAKLVKYDNGDYVQVDSSYISSQSLTSYTVTLSGGGNTIVLGNTTLNGQFTGTLTGGTAISDAYSISFSSGFAANKPNLYLELTATPNVLGLPVISGIFKPDLRAAGATDYWTGDFRDDNSVSPASYDGFNYLVTGTGEGTVTITWDSTKIQLSDVSLDMLLSITGATRSGGSITFPVDSDIESRYDIQFYKVNITSENWAQMSSSVVTFTFS